MFKSFYNTNKIKVSFNFPFYDELNIIYLKSNLNKIPFPLRSELEKKREWESTRSPPHSNFCCFNLCYPKILNFFSQILIFPENLNEKDFLLFINLSVIRNEYQWECTAWNEFQLYHKRFVGRANLVIWEEQFSYYTLRWTHSGRR